MNREQVDCLKQWLGREGAVAGLEASSLSVMELYSLASMFNQNIDKRTKRRDLAKEIVNHDVKRIDKSNEDLMEMDFGTLKKYLEDSLASRAEIIARLAEFGIRPGSDAKRHLVEFMASVLIPKLA
jgi:hypothetical protein